MADVAGGEEFAALLRSLKDRSGRSYEALARRTAISRSALHRYCSGCTVPPEFAPIERIGRSCGASREELVELHRRWAVAAAARDAAPSAPTTTEPDEPEPEPDPAARAPEEAASPLARSGGNATSRRAARLALVLTGAAAALLARSVHRRRAVAVVAAVATLLVTGWWLQARSRGSGPAPSRSPSAGANPYRNRMLFSPACAAPIYMGQNDSCVRELQELLRRSGTTIAVDGSFGPETLRKVTGFQLLAGLPPNGIADDATKRALYAGTVRMASWSPTQVERRIRQVFPANVADMAVRIADCQSFFDPFYVLPNVNGTRNWGVFQLADVTLSRYGGTRRQAFDPEWNIQTARKVWAEHRDFRAWRGCAAAAGTRPTAAPSTPGRHP
jgi:hypothetical protein